MGDGILKRGRLWLAAHRVGSAATFALIGWSDVFAHRSLLPDNSGLLTAANSPGKNFFYIIQFPTALLVYAAADQEFAR